MKKFLISTIILSTCALSNVANAQGWTPAPNDSYRQSEVTPSSDDDLRWMTVNRAAESVAEPSPLTSGPQTVFRDPFVDPTSGNVAPTPTFAPVSEAASFSQEGHHNLQDTGYSTLDLLPNELPPETSAPQRGGPPPGASLLSVAFDARWEPKEDGFGVSEFWGGVRHPVGPPLFGGAPPVLSFNFGITDLKGSGLGEFFDFSVGLNWVKPVNQQWTWMLGIKPGIATDFDNTSSDMWRIRANAFAIYAVSPMTQWIFGAVATGRSDLPVLPAVGVIWWPREQVKVDLTFPRPRVTWLMKCVGDRERWMYVGGELGGGTWAVGLPGGFEDELTYRAYRLAIGMEFLPAGARRPGGQPVTRDAAYIEAGLSFGRELELETAGDSFEPESVLYLGGGVRF